MFCTFKSDSASSISCKAARSSAKSSSSNTKVVSTGAGGFRRIGELDLADEGPELMLLLAWELLSDAAVDVLKDISLFTPLLLPPLKLLLVVVAARLLEKLLVLLLVLLLKTTVVDIEVDSLVALVVVAEVAKDSCIVGRLDPPHAVGVGLGNSAVVPVLPEFLEPKLEIYSRTKEFSSVFVI